MCMRGGASSSSGLLSMGTSADTAIQHTHGGGERDMISGLSVYRPTSSSSITSLGTPLAPRSLRARLGPLHPTFPHHRHHAHMTTTGGTTSRTLLDSTDGRHRTRWLDEVGGPVWLCRG